jgi:hypothetical protein
VFVPTVSIETNQSLILESNICSAPTLTPLLHLQHGTLYIPNSSINKCNFRHVFGKCLSSRMKECKHERHFLNLILCVLGVLCGSAFCSYCSTLTNKTKYFFVFIALYCNKTWLMLHHPVHHRLRCPRRTENRNHPVDSSCRDQLTDRGLRQQEVVVVRGLSRRLLHLQNHHHRPQLL